MTDRTGREVTLGSKEWMGLGISVAAIILSILGSTWKLSMQSEARFTKLETQMSVLSDEVNRLRDRPPQYQPVKP